ncbi:MAG: hypothetical protein GTO03_03000 [Planctomycetales bacterium]|nr:hypothetical protein [Planctomycetales bacterium]
MSDLHVIRLNEPWQQSQEDRAIRYQRRFHAPTGLTTESVWLVLEKAPGEMTVRVNGQRLSGRAGESGGVEFEITRLLGPRNEIEVHLPVTDPLPRQQTLGQVQLEIRAGTALQG